MGTSTQYAEGYAAAQEILDRGSALTELQIGHELDRGKQRRRIPHWNAGYAAAHMDYLHGLALVECATRDADVITLRVDQDGRLVTTPGTMAGLECGCFVIRPTVLVVGDHELCLEHGPTVVDRALETAIVG